MSLAHQAISQNMNLYSVTKRSYTSYILIYKEVQLLSQEYSILAPCTPRPREINQLTGKQREAIK
jgi:hypothetical protein